MIETHCHLDYLKNEPLDEIIEKSKKSGIESIITIAVEPNNFDRVFEISQQYSQVYFTQGIHPHDASKFTPESLEKIRLRSKEDKFVAVGEIGLDYYYDNSPRDTQKAVFEKHMQLACEINKPVVIHSREADEDMMTSLKNFPASKGVIHSFTAGDKLAQTALDQGYYLGFNGIITFKSAQNVRDIVAMTPLERILIETDSPFLTPVPHRGKENAPYQIVHVAQKIAELKKVTLEEVVKVTSKNARELFTNLP